MRDYTFLLTANINEFLRGHDSLVNGFIIYSSMLMDFLIISFSMLYIFYWKTSRPVLTYALFFGFRIIVQVSPISRL